MGGSGTRRLRFSFGRPRALGQLVHRGLQMAGGRAHLCLRRTVPLAQPRDLPAGFVSELKLWIAQGFGVGRIPFAPGAFGSLIGVVWFALLLGTGNVWVFTGGATAGIGLSVWLCGAGEKILGEKDASSIVLDEITALPMCYLAWVAILFRKTGSLPTFEDFFAGSNW